MATNSHKLLTSLGILLFHALDYGLCDDEERTLSKPLEILIERLTSANELASTARRRLKRQRLRAKRARTDSQRFHSIGTEEGDDDSDGNEPEGEEDEEDEEDDDVGGNTDEGIEDCHEHDQHGGHVAQLVNFDQVMQMCVSRLASQESADLHYKAVCRALVTETLELSTFLDQISKGAKELRKSSVVCLERSTSTTSACASACTSSTRHGDESVQALDKLQFHDWARLWIQVIRELRHGVKLKKVDASDFSLQHHREYELTPYEMLLEDIRARRYKLNKVMINGEMPPKLKKDAHELILDFIRSRPPLVPVAKRVLRPPPPKEPTVYEKLMQSIRQEHKLRPTPTRPRSVYGISLSAHTTPAHRKASEATLNDRVSHVTPSTRRKLVKANIKLNLSLEDEDESISVMLPERTEPPASLPVNIGHSKRQEGDDDKENRDDKSKEGRINRLRRFFSRERRHSVAGVSGFLMRKSRSHHDLGLQRRHDDQDDESDEEGESPIDFDRDTRNHVATIWEGTELGKSLECLSLTLKEVQHIRSVLTRAEVESLGVTRTIKRDLENGKICFTCLKTRFTFWGPWATVCKLCNRSICERCATRMHIPSEQFDHVPIYMLSPTPSPPNEKSSIDLFNWTKHTPARGTSATSAASDSENESQSLPPKIATTTMSSSARSRMSRIVKMLSVYPDHDEAHGLSDVDLGDGDHSHHSGPLVKVCRDCKILVRHLIDIGRTNFSSSCARA